MIKFFSNRLILAIGFKGKHALARIPLSFSLIILKIDKWRLGSSQSLIMIPYPCFKVVPLLLVWSGSLLFINTEKY